MDLQLDRKKHTVVVTANKDILIATDDIGDVLSRPQLRDFITGEQRVAAPVVKESYRQPDGDDMIRLRAALENSEAQRSMMRMQIDSLRSMVDDLKAEMQSRAEQMSAPMQQQQMQAMQQETGPQSPPEIVEPPRIPEPRRQMPLPPRRQLVPMNKMTPQIWDAMSQPERDEWLTANGLKKL